MKTSRDAKSNRAHLEALRRYVGPSITLLKEGSMKLCSKF